MCRFLGHNLIVDQIVINSGPSRISAEPLQNTCPLGKKKSAPLHLICLSCSAENLMLQSVHLSYFVCSLEWQQTIGAKELHKVERQLSFLHLRPHEPGSTIYSTGPGHGPMDQYVNVNLCARSIYHKKRSSFLVLDLEKLGDAS